jgi:hypothetical protein
MFIVHVTGEHLLSTSELLGWLDDRMCRPLVAVDSLPFLGSSNDSRLLNVVMTFFLFKLDLRLEREYCQSKHAVESSPYRLALPSLQLEPQALL